MFASRLAWVRTAPLGAPVVPDVNPMRAGCPGLQFVDGGLRRPPTSEIAPLEVEVAEVSSDDDRGFHAASDGSARTRDDALVVGRSPQPVSPRLRTWRSLAVRVRSVDRDEDESADRSTRQTGDDRRDRPVGTPDDPCACPEPEARKACRRPHEHLSSNSPAADPAGESGPPLRRSHRRESGLPGSAAQCRAQAAGREPTARRSRSSRVSADAGAPGFNDVQVSLPSEVGARDAEDLPLAPESRGARIPGDRNPSLSGISRTRS